MQWTAICQFLLVSFSCMVAFTRGFSDYEFGGGVNFSGITLPDPKDFDPYPDPPIKNDPKTPTEIENLLKEYRVIPDVLDVGPKYPIRIHYESPFKNSTVEFGTILKMLEVEVDPVRVTWPYTPGSFYTLILTDPDVPTPEKPWDREFHHWLVGNIHENDWKNGEVLTEYIGTIPPEKAGMHRFVFIVFEQPKGKIHFDEPSVYDIPPKRKRNLFSTVNFAKKYHLGLPYAVNFFQVKFEDWIPTVRNWTTPLFGPLSSEWTTVFQRSPKPKPTRKMRPRGHWTRPTRVFTAVTPPYTVP